MPSQIIPKEHVAACQRWKMDALESVAETAGAESCGGAGIEDSPQPSVILPTVEQIERIHQQARQEGYDAGYQAGVDAGREAGLQGRNEQTGAEVARLQDMFLGFQREMEAADQVIAGDVLALALILAREMVREALRVKPELILAVVRECIRQDSLLAQPAQLFLHPDDAVLVKEHLKQELNDCKILVDSALERGSCRVRVGSSEIDATLATRWQRIAQALGRDSEWLE